MADRPSHTLNLQPPPGRIKPLPQVTAIPRVIHQTYPRLTLPDEFRELVDGLKAANPGWTHRLYDDAAIESFIEDAYGADIRDRYLLIDRRYGAARADLFRYLLIYKVGGVYLDIKSSFSRPIDDVLQPGDRFLLSRWDNGAGGARPTFGLHRELSHLPGGELQQWHVIGAPGHPFLKAVIETVLENIERYSPWRHGAGKRAVLRVTGPVAYTLAIAPLMAGNPHRLVRTDREAGLVYDAPGEKAYRDHLPRSYRTLRSALIHRPTAGQFAYDLVRPALQAADTSARWVKRRVIERR